MLSNAHSAFCLAAHCSDVELNSMVISVNFGAYMTPGGKKGARQGYYFHLQPRDQSFLAGGLYMPSPKQLTQFRRAIDRDAAPFKKIIRAKKFVEYFGPLEGTKLATAPKGYPKDHPEIELLKLKEVTVARRLSDREVSTATIVSNAARGYRLMMPFLKYLDSTMLG